MFKVSRALLIASVALCVYSACLIGSMVGGMGIAVVVICVIILASKRRCVLTAFGTARFAGEADLRQAGMLDGPGLSIGRLVTTERPSFIRATLGLINPAVESSEASNRFLRALLPKSEMNPPLVRLSRSVHSGVYAPTGAGKGVSIFVPDLLDNPESCVVVDFGGSLSRATMEQRREMGHRICLVDPHKIVTQSPDTFNPIESIKKDSLHAIDDIRVLADSQVIRTGHEHDRHFDDMSAFVISAMGCAVVQYADHDDRSMQTIRELVSDPQKMEMAGKILRDSHDFGGMLARMGHQLTYLKDKELGSTLTTVNRHMSYLDTPAIAASTRASTFDPAELRTSKMSVYLILPPEYARTESPLLRMWISSTLRAVVRGGLQEQKLVYFDLDEAASLGHLEVIDDAVDKYRAYGVRLIFGFQSVGQLKKCFPDGQDQTLLSNTTQVFFGVNDLPTAEYVSNRLGEETIVVDSGGTSRGSSWQSGSRDGSGSETRSFNSNDNWQQKERKLLTPSEVMALSPRVAITFAPGVRAIISRLVRYYENRPESVVQRTTKGLQAIVCAVALLWASVFVARKVAESYQYRLDHPPVRAVPRRYF